MANSLAESRAVGSASTFQHSGRILRLDLRLRLRFDREINLGGQTKEHRLPDTGSNGEWKLQQLMERVDLNLPSHLRGRI